MRALHPRCVGCVGNSLRLQSDKLLRLTHRHWPKAAPLGHLRAAAAIERGDRTAIIERVPRCRSRAKVTDRAAQRKREAPFITQGAAVAVANRGCSLSADDSSHTFHRPNGPVAHVPATQFRSWTARCCRRWVRRSPVTSGAAVRGTHVTAASAARTRLRLHAPRHRIVTGATGRAGGARPVAGARTTRRSSGPGCPSTRPCRPGCR